MFVTMCKEKFYLNGVVGHGYGSSFKVIKGQLIKVDINELVNDCDKEEEADGSTGRDNRNLVDKRENQRLSKDEIHGLRKQGVTGEEIVEHLVENSATFQNKTEFSQQKYIQKKKRKHVTIFTLLKPTTRNLVELYYGRGPTKICNLRMDSLAQILTQANVRAGSKLMVVESCSGLVVGSILERMGGDGVLIHLYTGTAPNRPALVDGYRFSDEILQNLYSLPIDQVATLNRQNGIAASLPVIVSTTSTDEVVGSSREESKMDVDSSVDQKEEPVKELETDVQQKTGNADDVDLNAAEVQSCEHLETASEVRLDNVSSNEVNPEEVRLDRKRGTELDKCEDGGEQRQNKKQKLDDAEEREKRRQCRFEQMHKAKCLIEKADMDGLIVAAKLHPTPIVMSLIDFVLPSRPVVVFCPYREPLVDCFIKLRERGDVLMLKLTETWLREYQVLPNRTHPSINMSGSGGYLLTAMTVATEAME